jgi:hypothetical protein
MILAITVIAITVNARSNDATIYNRFAQLGLFYKTSRDCPAPLFAMEGIYAINAGAVYSRNDSVFLLIKNRSLLSFYFFKVKLIDRHYPLLQAKNQVDKACRTGHKKNSKVPYDEPQSAFMASSLSHFL